MDFSNTIYYPQSTGDGIQLNTYVDDNFLPLSQYIDEGNNNFIIDEGEQFITASLKKFCKF